MKSILMIKGSVGADVDALRVALGAAFLAGGEGGVPLGAAGEAIGTDFDAGIRRWQAGIGVIADGIVGPRCQLLLGLSKAVPLALQPPLDLAIASRLFPATKPANIARYMPYVEAALGVAGLTDSLAVLTALGTIRAETEGFVPLDEFASKFNTLQGKAPFSAYDDRPRLGNVSPGDGERYRGRGFVQLRWQANYQRYGERIGLPLAADPDLANAPEVAAVLLALFLLDHATAWRQALARGNLARARSLVNGGTNGVDRFRDVFVRARAIWPKVVAAKRIASGRTAKQAAAATPIATKRASLTKKDAIDLRDRQYIPNALTLPDEFPPVEEMRDYLPRYTAAGLILDQGQESACTGFGLSCVFNYLRWIKAGLPAAMSSVSPRMIYTLARRYDEYAGQNYEGSSCRGALKGLFNHGVCEEADWPYVPEHSSPPKYGYSKRAAQNTLGVYFRIDLKSIVDMQAAVAQHRSIYVSAYTHAGWDSVQPHTAPQTHDDLPMIDFDGKPSVSDGHAFAIVGFNARGFILQNSWGTVFGAGGFAVIGYLDWLANGMDAWVVSLGVPGVIAGKLAGEAAAGGSAGRAGADRSKWWDTGMAYQHSVVLGNDGRVARYLTEDEPPRKLQYQAAVLPDTWFRGQSDATKRLVLYVHGGLNSEGDAIKRASAMGRYFIGNGCYPIFLVWKTGLFESIGDIIIDKFGHQPAGAGFGEWVTDKTDALIEKTIGREAAKPIWSEMKSNAGLAYEARRGGDLLVDALETLVTSWGDRLELHLIGHSAGSIALGHLLTALRDRKPAALLGKSLSDSVASVNLYAPACTVAFANVHYAIDAATMQRLYLDVLSDKVERDDNVVSIYRKSLLYLVSNALETDLRTPILGMARVDDESDSGWDGSSNTGDALAAWREAAKSAKLADRTVDLAVDQVPVAIDAGRLVLQAAGHGIFDNDIDVLNRTLGRITGKPVLSMPVEDLRGF